MLSACGSDDNSSAGGATTTGGGAPAPTGTAQVDCGGKKALTAEGSTAQKGAMEAFIAAYGQKCSGYQLAYNPTGSGNGVKNFTGGQVDFGGSDSALNKDKGEVDAAAKRCQNNPAWNLPLVFGPVALVYNNKDAQDLTLTGEVAAKIFSGAVTDWSDPAIAAVNGGKGLPGTKITGGLRAA